ncbi:FAD-dependent oxidoreductase [bacterium]|nr:FAD-dependent oxidoreductase [bacterium]
MKNFDIAVIGAGPAGLAASIVAAKSGAKVVLIDENAKPGGQLFKQIHKFFGSKAHQAGIRGIDIGYQFLTETKNLGVDVLLESTVWGIFGKQIAIITAQKQKMICAKIIILATGAQENSLRFPGWTLPGIMTAGAAQTMMHLHRVLPGKRVLMVGSGNVGLIVSYQLLQAGAEVVALLEAAPEIGGYFVHAAKIARAGVPILVSHTIKNAIGEDEVRGAVIVALDGQWNYIPGTEKKLDVDSVFLAVGLAPQEELARMCGCKMYYSAVLGGHVPIHDNNMETSVQGVFVTGDITGVEEASTAIEEGKIAGISAAKSLGLLPHPEAFALKSEAWDRLNEIRSGPFGDNIRIAKDKILRSS